MFWNMFNHFTGHGGWSGWGAWGACSETCHGGTRSRSRSCDNPQPLHGGKDCAGANTDTTLCDNPHCAGLIVALSLSFDQSGCKMKSNKIARNENKTSTKNNLKILTPKRKILNQDFVPRFVTVCLSHMIFAMHF